MKKLLIYLKELNTLLFFFCMFTILLIALDSSRTVDKVVLNDYDKIKHIFAFFVLAYFLFESTIIIHNFFKTMILISFASLIEYLQSLIGREASLMDLLASSSGVVLFIFFNIVIKKLKK